MTLTAPQADHFARIALGHVRREYPNKPEHTLVSPADAQTPSQLHPVFFGSFDWHSCVHSYWLLAHLLRRFPEMPAAPLTRELFDTMLVPEKLAAERAYFLRPSARGFKRPYGWAWLLKLAEGLARLDERRWSMALNPLAEVIAQRFRDFLPLATWPVRVGTHFNTAFALRLAADYAEVTGDEALMGLMRATAWGWYGADQDCQAWEPSADDFLSSALIEAECMRRLLPADRFKPWFAAFLPRVAQGEPATLFQPVVPADRTDGKLAHLDGLNLSRAWCWRALGFPEAAAPHLEAGLPTLVADYMGEHWLATYAVLALEA